MNQGVCIVYTRHNAERSDLVTEQTDILSGEPKVTGVKHNGQCVALLTQHTQHTHVCKHAASLSTIMISLLGDMHGEQEA